VSLEAFSVRGIALKEGLTRTIAYFDRLLSDDALKSQLAKEPSAEPS
jgi:hypothetical protein